MTHTAINKELLDLKHVIMSKVVEKVLSLLEREEISLTQSQEISGFLLDSLNYAKSRQDILTFLSKLKEQYEMFGDIYTVYSRSQVNTNEAEIMSRLEAVINQATN